jgi:hypothetical protein
MRIAKEIIAKHSEQVFRPDLIGSRVPRAEFGTEVEIASTSIATQTHR